MIKVAIGMLGAVSVLVGVLPTPAAAQLKGTAGAGAACMGDAITLRSVIPDRARIASCLGSKMSQLSPRCALQFAKCWRCPLAIAARGRGEVAAARGLGPHPAPRKASHAALSSAPMVPSGSRRFSIAAVFAVLAAEPSAVTESQHENRRPEPRPLPSTPNYPDSLDHSWRLEDARGRHRSGRVHGSSVMYFSMRDHGGTHRRASSFRTDATPIDEYPLENCIVNGVCLDLRHVAPRAGSRPPSSKRRSPRRE